MCLLRAFKKREVSKKYVCLVHGKVRVEHDVLNWPIARASHSKLQFGVDVAGRPAETEYQVVRYYPGLNVEEVVKLPQAAGHNFRKKAPLYQGFTLLECWPKTGRTHQIRVHFAHMKHPLVGDQTYAGKKRQVLDGIWCPRHFLHAANITFQHPRTHQPQTIEATLPADLEEVLTLLRAD
jgi:23S rRNA pseudouridine1911/1915/1917 synthase